MRKIIVSLLALLGGIYSNFATVTVQGWWHFGESTDYYLDSSANARRFGYAFSSAGSGTAGGVIMPYGCGGPLGTTGTTSANCVFFNNTSGSMWGPGGDPGYNPPLTNYVIECWCLPVAPAHDNSWLLMSGSSGGVALVVTNNGSGGAVVRAMVVGGGNALIGNTFALPEDHWTHLAIVVNESATATFYVNGVAHGAATAGATAPAGVIHACGDPGSYNEFHGYMDELRIATFATGAFSTADLLLRPAGPNICTQPQPVTVWDGGAAPFSIIAAFDTVSTYQWQSNSTNIPSATATSVTLPQVFLADSGTPVRCILSGSSINVTSSPATLTVVAPVPANIAAYRNLVTTETSLLAYFPVDGCTGATVTNAAEVSRLYDGTLELNGSYSGVTNSAFGQRALAFNTNGDVTLANKSTYEFPSGKGTIEALVYMSSATDTDPTIFSEASSYGGAIYYALRAKKDGSSLLWVNDKGDNLSWVVPTTLIGQLTHVAVTINNGTDVTAFANGFNLGTQVQSGFGFVNGQPLNIGSSGVNNPNGYLWAGTIDEVALYGTNLPANTIAIHSSKFQTGTNEIPATITALPATGSKTLLTGGSASFTVAATGSAPLAYQWTTNGSPIAGKTTATLTLSPTTTGMSSPTYGVTVYNPYGTTNSPTFGLNFVAPSDSYATKVMNDHPSAYWRLGEASAVNGATAVDQAGGHDGTYVVNSAPGYYSTNSLLPNIADPAVTFTGYDGSGNAYGCVEVPYSPVFNQNAPFSVECFSVPFYDGNDDGGVLVSSYSRPSGRQGWILGASYNSVNFDWFLFDGSSTLRQVNSAAHCSPNVLVHVVGVYDGTNAYVYVNGVLSGTWTAPITYVPNQSAALNIGARTSRYLGFRGVEDEVAFYGYALSSIQISNHFASLFTRAIITAEPVGVTNIEGSTITLTAAASGYVNTYQWYKDGSPLAYNTLNLDQTQHYPQNVNTPTLVISQAGPMGAPIPDSGSYQLVVSNPILGTNTIPVNVLITNDPTPPLVTSVQALGTPNAPPNPSGPSPYLVRVSFNKRIDPYQGTYTIAGVTLDPSRPFLVPQVAVAAPVGGDFRQAVVYTTGLTPGQSYTVNVSGVKDQTVSANPLVATNVTFRAPLLAKGLVQWDYYYLGTVSSSPSSDLAGSFYYPNAPMANGSSSTFDTTPITGGDLNNVGFGSAGDNYGDSLSGWITPTVSGNYTFFLASDDASELWLSTDADPQHVQLIANEPSCCHGFSESGTYTSVPITLAANIPYYIRALHVEGSGGDYVKVAWRIAGDSTPAASLQPIAGTYLSSYAPGPIGFNSVVFASGQLTISWTGTATLMQSTNPATPFNQWAPVSGNPTSPYQITPVSGVPHMFYRLQQ